MFYIDTTNTPGMYFTTTTTVISSFQIKSSPQLRRSPTRLRKLNQVHKFLRTILKWLKCCGQDPTFDQTAEIQKQGAHEGAEEPEPEEKTMGLLNVTERLGLTEGGIKAVEDTDWTQQRATTISEAIIRMFVFHDEKRRILHLAGFQCLTFSSHFQRHVYCWTQDVTTQKTRLQFSLLL